MTSPIGNNTPLLPLHQNGSSPALQDGASETASRACFAFCLTSVCVVFWGSMLLFMYQCAGSDSDACKLPDLP